MSKDTNSTRSPLKNVIGFLVDLKTPKSPFGINWPLVGRNPLYVKDMIMQATTSSVFFLVSRYQSKWCPFLVHNWASSRSWWVSAVEVLINIGFKFHSYWSFLKFSFSEKVTKIWKNLPLVLTLLSRNSCFVKEVADFFKLCGLLIMS